LPDLTLKRCTLISLIANVSPFHFHSAAGGVIFLLPVRWCARRERASSGHCREQTDGATSLHLPVGEPAYEFGVELPTLA
jgi:hypothetical protein